MTNMFHFVCFVVRSVCNYQKCKSPFPFKKPSDKKTVALFIQAKQSGLRDLGTVQDTQRGVLNVLSEDNSGPEKKEMRGYAHPRLPDGG